MIRRSIIGLCPLLLALSLFSCQSSDAGGSYFVPSGDEWSASESSGGARLSPEEIEERKRIQKEQKQAQKADARRKRREVTDKYLGVVYTPESKWELKSGKIRILLKGGSFNIYARGKNKKETPILASTDGFRSTFFSVLVGKSEYRLNREASVTSQVRAREEGAQIAYRLEDDLQIVIDFSTLASTVGEDDDIVKITAYTTNLTKNRQVLALKAVFDTVLGENLDYHFLSALGQKIDSERQYTLFDDEQYFISTNTKTTAQFLLAGKSILTPQTVSFANKDVLANSLWTPVIRESKSFTTALSYNNSAMCVNWPYFAVEPGETTSFTFYIGIGTDGDPAHGVEFIDSLVNDARTVQTFAGANEIVVKKPDVDFVAAPVTENQLDPEYIQNLIDRINALNSDPQVVDRTEVRQLNAELDAILDRLRRMNQ